MRILILGAGATGGYYGGRLAKAGVDVTFLVRPQRAAALRAAPLKIESPKGDMSVAVKTITASDIHNGFDAVILSCKSYDLESAIAALHPAMHATTLIVPLLNGMAHLATLDAAFGVERVLGGSCQISVTLRPDGVIHCMSDFDALTLGPLSQSQQAACDALAAELTRGGFEVINTGDVRHTMWAKWVVLATFAATTTLMRAHTGEIAATSKGADLIRATLAECCAISAANGVPMPTAFIAERAALLTDPVLMISASMRRDLEAGRQTEARHIIGDLIEKGRDKAIPTPMLDIAFTALEAYQNRLAQKG